MKVSVSTIDTAWNGKCTSCVDNFAKRVPVTPRWQRFVLRFDELKQEGWGAPQVPFKLKEIVQFQVSLEQVFDVWVDEVSFEALPAASASQN